MEPPPFAAAARGTPRSAGPSGVHDLIRQLLSTPRSISRRRADPRSAFVAAGLGAAAVGALGTDGGLLWLVFGVWTVRAVAGGPLGLGWGIAAVGAGLRWGTLGLGDLEVATRVAGPTILAGPVVVRAGMVLALAGALAGEIGVHGFDSRSWGPRAAAALVAASLGPLFVLPGPSGPADVAVWALVAAAATVVPLLVRSLGWSLPGTDPSVVLPEWLPAAVAAAGTAIAVGGS